MRHSEAERIDLFYLKCCFKECSGIFVTFISKITKRILMSNIFANIRQAITLFKSVDFEKLSKISQRVDIPKLMDNFSKLDDKQLKGLMKMMDQDRPKRASSYRWGFL